MNSLKEYGDLFERLGLSELSVEEGDFKLTLKKKIKGCEISDRQEIVKKIKPEEKTEQKVTKKGTEVKAPLLGIFYGKVGEKEPLKVGDKVSKGDCLCTIEAMKMLNEVSSPIDGEIKAISAKEGELVEYNQTLFIID